MTSILGRVSLLLILMTLPPFFIACQNHQALLVQMHEGGNTPLKPHQVTEPTPNDTDDPAIWIHADDPEKSLILGTDKNSCGGLYVYDLQGRILREKSISNLKRPNNVDVEYGMLLGGRSVDIAVVTERESHQMRVFQLPEMAPVDGGGLPVFEGETGDGKRDLMGISLYRRSGDGAIFAIISRKNGPPGTYLWQYLLHDNGTGLVRATLVRRFGMFSGKKEIEAIAVDDQLGYVYYSDEGFGVRKYYADPSRGNAELTVFATHGFTEDHEGISIYCQTPETGYILVSDQAANKFHIFPREGAPGQPHHHPLLEIIATSTHESDGSEITATPMGMRYPKGLFVAMSTDRTFHYYDCADILQKIRGNP